MLKKFIGISLVLSSMFALTACGNGGEAKKEEVKDLKIITTTVAATEVTDKLDLNLVGKPTSKNPLPERYKDVTEVGSAMKPNMEIIVSQTPDLVIIDNNFKGKYEKDLAEKNLKPLFFDTSSVDGFKNSVTELGKLTNRSDNAKKLVEEIEKSVNDELKKGNKLDKKVKVAILFGTAESSMLATDKSYIGDLVQQIGVENITDGTTEVGSGYINFSLEEVVKQNPDYILRLSHGNVEQAKKDFDKMFSENPAWSSLSASKNGKVIDLNPKLFGVSANIRVGEAIKELGKMIYGEK